MSFLAGFLVGFLFWPVLVWLVGKQHEKEQQVS